VTIGRAPNAVLVPGQHTFALFSFFANKLGRISQISCGGFVKKPICTALIR
jgi:hypothetical protein